MNHENEFAIFLGALLLLTAGLVLVAMILSRLGKRASKPRSLKPHFLRLGRVTPDDVCPCTRNEESDLPYEQCCRPADVEKLERDVRESLWRRWAKRSYGGRRRMRTFQQRLDDFPMPEVVLPNWVTHPEDHVFPIEERRLRAWRPDCGPGSTPSESPLEDSRADDVI